MSKRDKQIEFILQELRAQRRYLEEIYSFVFAIWRRPATIRIHLEGATMPVTLAIGQSVVATATEADAQGVNVPIANPSSLSWTTSDPSVASSTTNPDGTATFAAVAAGTATVTVTDASNGLTTSDTITVTPAADVPVSIAITFGTPS